MALRNISSQIKSALADNDSLLVYHLVKFEKPSQLAREAEKDTDYIYLTDAPYEVKYDPEHDENHADYNPQTYTPGGLLKVGKVPENTEAKATSLSLTLSATKLGKQANAVSVTNSAISSGATADLTVDFDLFKSGFYAGDVVKFTKRSDSSVTFKARIDSLFGDGTKVKITNLEDTTIAANSSVSFDIRFDSSEVDALVAGGVDNSGSETVFSSISFDNYINRSVTIYRVFANPADGTRVGDPVLLFRGIIAKGTLNEKAQGASTITWSLTSHWGDFIRVSGRITSDEFHRGLDSSGLSDQDSALRPEYVHDLGFMHADSSLNVLATYTDIATRGKSVKRGGLAGLFGGTKYKEEKYEVTRELDLSLNLEAKHIPVVYGVQKVDTIPVFADVVITQDDNSTDNVSNGKTELFQAQVLCEGPIGGVYDIYMEDKSLVCRDKADSDVRLGSADDIPCFGRMDRGDVLTGGNLFTNTPMSEILYGSTEDLENTDVWQYDPNVRLELPRLNTPDTNFSAIGTSGKNGILHEQSFRATLANDIQITVHAGRDDQEANQTLLGVANSTDFLVQQQYYQDDASTYWTANHKLLDTAYVVTRDSITAEDGKAPELSFVVRGKFIDCHNYDGSYRISNGLHTNFGLGDEVSITLADGTTSGGTARIVDKWSFLNASNLTEYRIRLGEFSSATSEASIITNGDVGKFSITKNSDTLTFLSPEYSNNPSAPVSPTDELAVGGFVFSGSNFTNKSVPIERKITEVTTYEPIYVDTADGPEMIGNQPVTRQNYRYTLDFSSLPTFTKDVLKVAGETSALFDLTLTANSYTTTVGIRAADIDASTMEYLVTGISGEMEAIFGTPSNAAGTTTVTATGCDFVNRSLITQNASDSLNPTDTEGVTIEITEEDVVPHDYSIRMPSTASLRTFCNTNSILCLSRAIHPRFTIANAKYKYGVQGSHLDIQEWGDFRVSTNPAIQLLDYLTNDRYGKGLSLQNDIDITSFREVARSCDTASDVTVIVPSTASISVDEKYRYPATGDLLWEGKVSSVKDITYNIYESYKEVTFTNCIGKLGRKWNNWYSYSVNELVWTKGGNWELVTSAGVMSTEPTTPGGVTVNLRKVGSSPAVDVALNTTLATNLGNPFVKKLSNNNIITGYSLYDSDDVKYWKYVGWDTPDQRFVTRHQTNMTLDTSQSLFDNVNSMLRQFNGILRFANGTYFLDQKVKAKAISDFTSDEIITEDFIVGDIKISDKGIQKTFNSVNAQIIDPANNFEPRSISFYNSNYKKQDKGVPRQGSYEAPGISNYFNARMNIKQALDESRAGLDISFTMAPRGYMLLAGNLIAITYDKFNWIKKLFRIESLNTRDDLLVDIVAKEHNDNAYVIEAPASDLVASYAQESGGKPPVEVRVPTTLTASNTGGGGIDLSWTNANNYSDATHTVEIWRSSTTSISGATLIGTTKGTKYTDQILETGAQTRYYWIRYSIRTTNSIGNPITSHSLYEPRATEDGVDGNAISITTDELNTGVTVNDGGITFPDSPTGNPNINAGITSIGAGNSGFFLGWDGSNHVFQVGDPTGDSFTFDGTDLTLEGGQFAVTAGGTAPSINGTTLAGKGILLKSDGDVLFGDSAGSYVFFDQDQGTLEVTGKIIIEDPDANPATPPTISGASVSGKGILLEPSEADVFFGDATATDIADHRYVFFDQSEGTLSIKGTLAPTAFDFDNTSDITLPTNIPASAVVNGSIGPSAFTQEVWNEIDSRQGTGSGGFYSNASGYYLGEATKYITITNADHGEENVTLEAIINDSFTYPRNFAAGSSNLKITISFEAKKSSEGSSAWAHVGPVISTANDFYAVPTLYQYATNYTINATYVATITTGLDDNVDYDFRVKIVRGHTSSVFRAYTDGGANDATGTPVLFEAIEQSTGGLSSGNLTTDETVAHRGDADTYLQFTDDQIDIYAGGVHFATFEEDIADSITLRQDTTIVGDLKLGDTREIQFGDDDDLKIVHSGGTGTIQNDTGDLYIKNRTQDGDIYFQSDDGTGLGTDTYFFLDGGDKNTKFLEEVIISSDLTVTGDLNITGEINSNNVTNLQVDDKTITVNNGGGTTTSDGAGLIVDRGSETDASFTWNETDDLFELNFPAKITKSTQNAPVLHLYHSYDGGYRDTLLIENPNDRDAGITFKTGGGQYEMWIDSNGDDSLIFSPGDGTSSIAMELYQNKNVDFGGSINVTGGIEFNPNGDNILANTDGNRDLFLFERNGSTSWQVWHTTDQHLNFDPANSAYKLQYDGYDVWHRGDLTDTNKTNYDTAYTYSQVGHLPLTGGTISGNVSFGENDKVYFGTDNDFQIRHAGTTYLDNTSGNLNIRNLADDMDIVLSCDDGSGGIKTYMTLDGSIDTLKAQTKFQVLPGENRTNGFDYSATNTISNQNHTMMRLDFNFSGTETHTTDNYKYGLYIDYDSSDSGGDTNNETRLFPLYIDARNLAGGTADRLDAAYLYARTNGSADMAQLRGLNSYALALNSGGTVTNLYGSQSTATAQPSGTGSVTNVFGAHNTAQANGSSGQTIGQLIGASNHATTNSNNTCDITSMFGSWNEVQLDATNNAHTISNMYAVYALIDENDTGSDHTVNNSYLFFGDYQGNLTDGSTYSGINAFGVYIADDVENRFMGRVRAKEFDVGGVLVIDTNRTAKLTGIKHDNTGDLIIDLDDNTYVKINNPDGTEAIKIGGGGSTDAMNTYKNDIHRFYKANGTTELAQFYQGMASFYDNDVDANSYYADGKFQSGTDNADGFWVGNTQIVEGDTRNLKNIGSIESSSIEVGDAAIDTTSTTTTATTQVTIDSFATTSFRSARYTVQVTNTTDSTYHLTEILLIHDGTTPSITEYGTIFTGSAEAAFDADISSGNVRLLATPTTNDSMTFKVVRHCITV